MAYIIKVSTVTEYTWSDQTEDEPGKQQSQQYLYTLPSSATVFL